jgi:segregation and condensation protein B
VTRSVRGLTSWWKSPAAISTGRGAASPRSSAPPLELSRLEQLVLTVVAYFQPVTRQQIADVLGNPVGRDTIAGLRGFGLVATGPRSPQPGAPYTYVTTPAFLELAGLPSLRDLPDYDRLEAAGLLGTAPLPEELRRVFGTIDDEPEMPEIHEEVAAAED